jgi:xylobiose transport system substrate-binding protein
VAATALVAGAAVVAISAGASGAKVPALTTAASSRPANQISILMYEDAQNTVEKWVVQQYNATAMGKKVPAKITYIPGADYQQKLQTVMSTPNAPDLFFNWGGGSILQFQKAGLLLPLNQMMQQNPKLKNSFLPSVLNAAKVGSNYYGIPMRGTQPVFLYYNKKVLKADHVSVPKTFPQLISASKKLAKAGVQVPIALGGGDQWPTLMWYEYLYDRVAGPSLVTDALAGKSSVWNSSASKKALSDIKELVKSGAFGPAKSWDSIKFTTNQTAELMVDNQSGFELMGSWYYSTIQSLGSTAKGTAAPNGPGAAFAKSQLGWTSFPSVPGGKGNASDLAGNTENYYSVLKNTRYPDAVADFLKIMYSTTFLKKELALGNLTTTKNTGSLISGPQSGYLKYTLNAVSKAKAFQLSWDQAWPQTNTTLIHTTVANYFDNLNANAFIKAFSSLKAAA